MADEPTGAVWVRDPQTGGVYQGFPFDGLEVLEVDGGGQPVMSGDKYVVAKKNKSQEAAK